MAALWGNPGAPGATPAHEGLITRIAASIRHLLGRDSPAPGPAAPAEAPPEQEAAPDSGAALRGRFSIEELDAAIAESLQRGAVDLDAAEELARLRAEQHAAASAAALAAQMKEEAELKAYGGDLYPTAVHGFGDQVKHVRLSKWGGISGKPPPN